jgi:hypothetical protein
MRRPAHVLLLALVPACYDPSGYETLLEYYTTEDSDSDSGSDDSANSSPPISTVTTEPPPHGSDSDSDSSSAGDTGDDTEGALPAPQIIEHEFTPGPVIFKNGPLTITVTAEGAEGVSMQLEDGSLIQLAALDPGLEHDRDPVIFQGELAVKTGLANGTQILGLTPWRGDLVGDSVTTSYMIDLPTPGEEIFWEINELSGSGIVKALGVLPSGDLVEFGQDTLDGGSRCYLRRRNQGGWSSFRSVLPGLTCAPIDMKIDADGAITLLAYRTGVGGTEWWLGQLSSWDAGVTNRGLGGKDELALALGVHPSGLVAVCGAAPSGHPDAWDAAAWIYRPNQFGEARIFDYVPEEEEPKPHRFTEIARDCALAGDTLVMVGEANGRHEKFLQIKRDRHFTLEFDVITKAHKWKVGGIEGDAQTGGRALTIDDQGRYITAGFICGDDCAPKATLRVHDPKGGDDWFAPVGDLPSLSYGPHDIAWSPAGYAVVVMGGAKGDEGAFWVRAFKPGSAAPLWTYSREDNKNFHMAIAVAIGAFGEVYAGGLGNSGYPAVAYIGG